RRVRRSSERPDGAGEGNHAFVAAPEDAGEDPVADDGADQPEDEGGQPGLPALEVLEHVVRDEQTGDGTRQDAENERTDHAFLLLADGLSAGVQTRLRPPGYVTFPFRY